MKNNLYLLLLILVGIACNTKTATDEPPVIGEWHNLLQDANLGDWEKMGDFEAKLEDNVLQLGAKEEDQNGWLLTKHDFSNFQLEFEFLPKSTARSIVFRYDNRLRTLPEVAGYKVSLDADFNQQNSLGTIVNTARGDLLKDFKADEWHKMTIDANGDHLKVFVDDELFAETHNRKRETGKIGLQVPTEKGTKIGFRNVKIKPLPAMEVTEPLLEERYRSATIEFEPLLESSLDGWQTLGDGKWEFKDGVVHGYSGKEGGFLVSDKTYKNFYLKLKFKIIKGDNSGIFIRKSPDRPDVSIEDAIECNIYDNNGPLHVYGTGSIATHARSWHDMIDYEDWNTMEIFAHNEHIVMYVNDQKSSEAHLPESFSKAGNICLQGGVKIFSEDKGPSDIYFKEMFIKDMDEAQ